MRVPEIQNGNVSEHGTFLPENFRLLKSVSTSRMYGQAPWVHLLQAINALVKGATSALQSMLASWKMQILWLSATSQPLNSKHVSSCCHSTRPQTEAPSPACSSECICQGTDSVTSSHAINFFASKLCFHRP